MLLLSYLIHQHEPAIVHVDLGCIHDRLLAIRGRQLIQNRQRHPKVVLTLATMRLRDLIFNTENRYTLVTIVITQTVKIKGVFQG